MSENVPKCSICSNNIELGQRFVAKRDDAGKWDSQHEACIENGSELASLPRFIMNAARAWVLARANV